MLLLVAVIGWAAAVRERERVEEVKDAARNAVNHINRDAKAALFGVGGPA